ncbi:MAG: DUF2807 domain-containing protein [Sphingomonas bacterium]|nr:DUF2807 domain-containing protein [Sphingomonas bacterium]
MTRIIAIAAAALAATACNVGAKAEERDPGSSVSRTYQLGAFDKIEVAGPYEVKVTTGGAPGASATGGDKLLDETEVVVDGDTLKIRPKKKNGIRFTWGKTGKAQFVVTTAMLHGAMIAGSGGISVDKVDGDFKGAIGGSGDLALAAVKGGAIDFVIGGSGTITAAGTAQSTNIKIGGSGKVDASALAAKTTSVAIGGHGNVKANASDNATVKIAGSGDVTVTGGAKCNVSKAGSGNVTCG